MNKAGETIRAQPGTYALILFSPTKKTIEVGRLGPLPLQRGFYVYLGSARGPGGVRARLAHHQKVSRRPHWHIDYLRAATELRGIWCSYEQAGTEHQWAEAVKGLPGAQIPLAGFGSSDCDCESHLYFFETRPLLPHRALLGALVRAGMIGRRM
jgi:Uri superfamily endonuclease